MKRRVAAMAMVLALATAPLGCNGGKPNPKFKRTPAGETIMDAGAKKVAVKKGQVPPKKLDAVPRKAEEKPGVQPIEPNPFVHKEEKPKKGEKPPEKYDLSDLKLRKTERSDYKPWEDKRSWYAVDEEGKRIYGKDEEKKKPEPKQE